MPVEMTEEQYGVVARALVVIASGRRYRPGGKSRRVSREEMVQRAREAASVIRLAYLGDGQGNSAFPEEIGLEHKPQR